MEETISITRTQLTEALRKWDQEAKSENWPERTDPQRFADSAEYLFSALSKA